MTTPDLDGIEARANAATPFYPTEILALIAEVRRLREELAKERRGNITLSRIAASPELQDKELRTRAESAEAKVSGLLAAFKSNFLFNITGEDGKSAGIGWMCGGCAGEGLDAESVEHDRTCPLYSDAALALDSAKPAGGGT